MIRFLILCVLAVDIASGFVVLPIRQITQRLTAISQGDDVSIEDAALDWIGHQLKLEVYDPGTSVFGFGSKDPKYGIEVIRVSIPVVESSLGLDLVELAHGEQDSRGLVLINSVSDVVEKIGRIKTGDTIVGVFVGDKFKMSTTAMDLRETMGILEQAKVYAAENGIISIDLELNRLVTKQPVKLILESDWRDGDYVGEPLAEEIEALSGDNLRTLLLHHHKRVYDDRTVRLDTQKSNSNCGGEGICGTCLVEILEGMEALNPKGPQEKEVTTGRPESWRASCCVVIGVDNLPGETVRIRLHPQSSLDDELRHPGAKQPHLSS